MVHFAAILALGLFLGMRHATDADHVVAVSTIVSRERALRAAVPVGIAWGLGHTVTVLLVGGGIILFGIVIPPRIALGLELSVALMLVLLGTMNVRTFAAGAPRFAGEAGGRHRLLRPLMVGVMHGLAGSAAIALLVLATIRDPLWATAYLLVFGLGTIVGMAVITAALATPIVTVAKRFDRLHRSLGAVTGLASVAFGALMVYEIGFVHGLFTGQPK